MRAAKNCEMQLVVVSMHIIILPLRNKLSSSHIYSRTEFATLAEDTGREFGKGKRQRRAISKKI